MFTTLRSLAHRFTNSSAAERVSDLDPMAIRRSQPELAHAPGFVFDFGKQLRALRFQISIVSVRIVNTEIGEVTVTTERARRHIIRALAQHDHAIIFRDENPASWFIDDAKAKHFNVKFRRPTRVMHGQHIMILQDL